MSKISPVNIFAFIICLSLIGTPANANPESPAKAESQRATRLYNAPPNLSTLLYHDFCQDKTGFMWIATESGIIKFDGSNYEIFRNDKNKAGSISDNRINRIFCDSRGDIWVGTANGLNYFNPVTETFEVVKLPPSEKLDGYIQDIAEQNDGTIIFNVAGNGLYLVDPFHQKNEAMRLAANGAKFDGNSILIAKNGNILMGTHKGNIQVIRRNGNLKDYALSDNYILGLCAESATNVLAYGPNNVWRLNTETMESIAIDVSEIGNTAITKLCVGKDNNVYMATNQGLWHMAVGDVKMTRCRNYFNSSIDIDKAKIGAVYVAPDGNLWAGCNYQGTIMAPLTPFPFNYYPLQSKIHDFRGGITAMTSGRSGLWLSMEDGDIVNLSSGNHLKKRIKVETPGDVRIMYNDNDRAIYAVTTEGGLWKIDPDSGSLSKLTDLNKYAVTFRIAKADVSQDDIYISIVGNGFMRYNAKTGVKTEFKSDAGNAAKLNSDWISSIFIDSKKRLWLGLYSGLSCYHIPSGEFREINQEPFMRMAVNAFNETKEGKILLGTSNGLIIYNPDVDAIEKTFTNVDGLADNDVRTIQIDNAGIAWIGTMLGLSQYNPKTGNISSIHGGYGLSETSFIYSAFNRERDEMYFAGNLGYTSFNPASVKSLKLDRQVYVSGIYLNGDKLSKGDIIEGEKALVPDDITGYSHIRLSHKDNNLLIKVTTMDFRDPENVAYEWKIDGSDSWTVKQPGNSAIVIPGLSPGNHKLLIRASDNSDYSPVTEISIHVTKPWYLTWPAKSVYALIAVGVILLLLNLYKKRNLERLNEEKVRFFIDISHEIRSPITCIISPLKSLLRKDLDPETKSMLARACRNAERILGLANQLLEIRKIDKGKKSLSMQPTDLKGFTEEIIELYRPMAQGKDIDICLNVTKNMPEVWIDRANFDKVLVNLITNAIKYTPDNGKIVVGISETVDADSGKWAEITVTDSGIGIDPKNIEKIFDRFYQGHSSVSGFGIGLNLARQLVALHHGTLMAANRSDGTMGSIFTVRIPVGKSHLTAKEIKNNLLPETIIPSGDFDQPMVDSMTENDFNPTPRKTYSRKILIVDDDKELREYIAAHFSRSAKVVEASDGNEAMKILLNNNIDLIISDVAMPVMDGMALLRTVKTNAETNHIPVILLSSHGEIADRLAGWGHGADGYVNKPFDIAELAAMADNLIANRLRMKGKYSGAMDPVEKITAPEIKGNDEILIDRIVKTIESHIDDSSLNVESLSEEIGISRAHLHRRLKQLVGMSPSEYIRNIRVKHACELLKRQDIDVTQVAFGLGFTSQPHFSTSFKRFTGMTPTEYRAMHMKEPQEETSNQ